MKKLLLLFSFLLFNLFCAKGQFIVNDVGDAGIGAGNFGDLRYCIDQANSTPGPHTIEFDIAPAGEHLIQLGSALPTFREQIELDATTQPGYVNIPVITLKGGGPNNYVALEIADNGSGSIIKGFCLNFFSSAIQIRNANNCRIQNCFIGTNNEGTARVNADQTFNQIAVTLFGDANSNIIGGDITERNIISGNDLFGVLVSDESDDNVIQNNIIGLDITGENLIGNNGNGILIRRNSTGTNVLDNVISGSTGDGIAINTNSNASIIRGNKIGTDINGNVRFQNLSGIVINTCVNTLIDDNIVSGNQNSGIIIVNGSETTLQQNIIGLNEAGTQRLQNNLDGVFFDNSNDMLISNNIISGNGNAGIVFNGDCSENTIIGNYVGVDVSGNIGIGNNWDGIIIEDGGDNNVIGGSTTDSSNVFSGSISFSGIAIKGSTGNVVKGNYCGTGIDGVTPIPNKGVGIFFGFSAFSMPTIATVSNIVGGTNSGEGNIVAFNEGAGVFVENETTDFITVRGNSIFCNGGKGIDLDSTGNDFIDSPIIDRNFSSLDSITGTAIPNSTVDLYYYDTECNNCDSTFFEGKTYIGSTTSDFAGNWSFTDGVTSLDLTSTTTDADGNTSEFSNTICCTAEIGSELTPSNTNVCSGSTINILYQNGQLGDSLMLQSAPNTSGPWTSVEQTELSDPSTFSDITITGNTFYRVVTFSNGNFENSICKDTSDVLAVTTQDCCTDSASISTEPVAPESVCNGADEDWEFTVATQGLVQTHQWQFSDNGTNWINVGTNSATLAVQDVTLADSGFYRVIVTGTSCGLDTSGAVLGIVYPLASASIDGDTTVCSDGSESQQITVTIDPSGSDYSVYYSGSQSGDGLITFPYIINVNTPDTITLDSVVDNNGCVSKGSLLNGSAQIGLKPDIEITWTTVCELAGFTFEEDEFRVVATITSDKLDDIIFNQIVGTGITFNIDPSNSNRWVSDLIKESVTDLEFEAYYDDIDCNRDQSGPQNTNCSCPTEVSLIATDSIACDGEQVTLSVQVNTTAVLTGDYNFIVEDPSGVEIVNVTNQSDLSFQASDSGIYRLINFFDNGTDANCMARIEDPFQEVVIYPVPSATLFGGGEACEGGFVDPIFVNLTGTGDWTINYTLDGVNQPPFTTNNPDSAILENNPANAGIYEIVSVTDNLTGLPNESCIANINGEEVEVSFIGRPSIALVGGGVVCEGDELPELTFEITPGSPPGSSDYTIYYRINDEFQTPQVVSNTTESIELDPIEGVYILDRLSQGDCEGTILNNEAVMFRIINPVITASASPSSIAEGQNVILQSFGNELSTTCNWIDPNGDTIGQTNCIDSLSGIKAQAGTYTVIAEDSIIGCKVNSTVVITIIGSVEIPDIFTPNDDGINDEWLIGGFDQYTGAQVTVYNRWGNIVYQKNNSEDSPYNDSPFDGRVQGKNFELPEGVYYYVIDFKLDEELKARFPNLDSQSGTILLVR